MENNDTEKGKYAFLNDKQVQKHFAELNIALLKGVHIHLATPDLFHLLDEFFDEFEGFYQELYGLVLQKGNQEAFTYYYLAFPPGSKGRLSYPTLYKELEDRQVLVGFVLCGLYSSKYFYVEKKFTWEDIRHEVEHGENKDAYQQLFFKDTRADFSDKEWEGLKDRFSPVVKFFNRIGLVEMEGEADELQFTILPTIHRFVDMYRTEITNIDEFSKQL